MSAARMIDTDRQMIDTRIGPALGTPRFCIRFFVVAVVAACARHVRVVFPRHQDHGAGLGCDIRAWLAHGLRAASLFGNRRVPIDVALVVPLGRRPERRFPAARARTTTCAARAAADARRATSRRRRAASGRAAGGQEAAPAATAAQVVVASRLDADGAGAGAFSQRGRQGARRPSPHARRVARVGRRACRCTTRRCGQR